MCVCACVHTYLCACASAFVCVSVCVPINAHYSPNICVHILYIDASGHVYLYATPPKIDAVSVIIPKMILHTTIMNCLSETMQYDCIWRYVI